MPWLWGGCVNGLCARVQMQGRIDFGTERRLIGRVCRGQKTLKSNGQRGGDFAVVVEAPSVSMAVIVVVVWAGGGTGRG